MADGLFIEDAKLIMRYVTARTKTYFDTELGITVSENTGLDDVDAVPLLDMTAAIGMGGTVDYLVAFSFQDRLVSAICKAATAGLEILPDELEFYRQAAIGETVNIILGNSTSDLEDDNQRIITMTTPVVFKQVKNIARVRDAFFCTQKLDTPLGLMTINLLGPQALFDANLEYVKGA